MEDRRFIRAGELILLSCGEYSNYGPIDVFRATQDFDLAQELRGYAALGPGEGTQRTSYLDGFVDPSDKEFSRIVAFLQVERRLIETLPCREVHLGSYGQIDPSLVCKHDRREYQFFLNKIQSDDPTDKMMMECCLDCREQFPEHRRPATAEEYYAAFPHARGASLGPVPAL